LSTPARLPLGPVVLDVAGHALTAEDRRRLLHPLAGGVILFARNYVSPEQLATLAGEIRALREPRLLVAADHEGGRVQRFRDGYTSLPPMAALGRQWDRDRAAALAAARAVGELIAIELGASGVDFSFTPVLDLDFGVSSVIGDRAFHRDPEAVAQLASALLAGLQTHRMAAVGKHFPGHGFVVADSHHAIPVDSRPLHALEVADLIPYARLIPQGLAAVMPAHVIYPQVDVVPAGFSRIWLGQVLRDRLGFQGALFSDDLAMEGASVAGGIVARATAALSAGCDLVLVCNRPDLADALLADLDWAPGERFVPRVTALQGDAALVGLRRAQAGAAWLTASGALSALSGAAAA
jgi:beta-N-acetylhexosaminidase